MIISVSKLFQLAFGCTASGCVVAGRGVGGGVIGGGVIAVRKICDSIAGVSSGGAIVTEVCEASDSVCCVTPFEHRIKTAKT